MGARELRVGTEYATASGLPVRVVAVHDSQVELQSLASDSSFYVPASYPLGPITGPNLTVARKSYPNRARGPAAGAPVRTNKPIAPIIDVILLAGGHTMRGIVRELRRKASASCRGKDLKANVRARIYWLKMRGYAIDSDTSGRLKACFSHETQSSRGASHCGDRHASVE